MRIRFFILFLLPIQLLAQNLVVNPGFEISEEKCVEYIGKFGTDTDNWTTPTLGTSDVFNACSSGRTGIPYNFSGHQETKFGERYAGCFFLAGKNYREYVQGKFSTSLEEGKEYEISFYVSLAETSGLAIKTIGVLLSGKSFKLGTSGSISERLLNKNKVKDFTLYNIESADFYDDKNGWMLVSVKFTAKGNESFITIGNFNNDFRTQKKLLSNSKGTDKSYYYIDMVSVEPYVEDRIIEEKTEAVDEEVSVVPEMISDPKQMEFGKSYIFENIMFDFNSIQLGKAAKEQIQSIYDFLLENENIQLIITGHTDNVGTNQYNQTLSEKRAKAVAAYLKQLGLEEKRIELAAFGKSEPLTSNTTDKGRSINRRVEFRITKPKPIAD